MKALPRQGMERGEEEVMRSMIIAAGLAAFAAAMLAQPAAAKKSKMGCEVGKEYWDATDGKCKPGKAPKKDAKKKE
jgi:hypothetical protein